MGKKALLISCFNWYPRRLKYVRELLISQGYDVAVVQSDYIHLKKNAVEERYDECTYIHVRPYKKNISVKRLQSHLGFGKEVNKYLSQYAPDLIYLLLPPNNTARFCSMYKKKNPQSVLIVDIIDLWPESMPLKKLKNTALAKIWRGWRDTCIKNADYIFTECGLYQRKLSSVLKGKKTSVLYLCKTQSAEEKDLILKAHADTAREDMTVRLAYLGSMNSIIDIDGICGVIRTFQEHGYKTELHVVGNGEAAQRFQAAVEETGCKSFFYGPIFDEKKKIELLAGCYYALNMMKNTVEVGLTLKSIDYLSWGLPIINSIKGDTWEIIEREHIGLNVDERGEWIHDLGTVKTKPEIYDIFCRYFSVDGFRRSLNKAFE